MAKFKEFRRGYQPWEHEGGGGGIMGGGGGGDLHASALDHDFVSTLGGGGSGPADPWEGLAEVLDETGWGTENMEKNAGTVGAWLRAEGARNILEVGSGLGRTTRKLLKDGFKVTALEASPALLVRTRMNAKGAKADDSNFVELPAGPFDAVVSMRNSFSRLAIDGQAQQMLASAKHALKPHGLLSFAFFNREGLDDETLNKVMPSLPMTFKEKRTILYDNWQGHPDGGDRFVWAPLAMVGDYSIDWVRRSIPFKYWRLHDVKAALKEAGFEFLGAFDANDGKTPASKSTRRIEVRARAR